MFVLSVVSRSRDIGRRASKKKLIEVACLTVILRSPLQEDLYFFNCVVEKCYFEYNIERQIIANLFELTRDKCKTER